MSAVGDTASNNSVTGGMPTPSADRSAQRALLAVNNTGSESDLTPDLSPHPSAEVLVPNYGGTKDNPKQRDRQGLKSSLATYPIGVFFMLGNEFCERFSFYGMRAVLTLYLTTIHHYEATTAKLIFHTFVSVCYFTPLIGSLLADGFLGRFRVILYGSIVYCIGHVLLTIGAVPNLAAHALQILDFFGLFVIAFATGGIKPCVSSFAADQFPADMKHQRERFFSFFYFSINLGALISKIVTPILRGRVSCLGQQTCFPLAFGIPSILMVCALLIFVCGKPFYSIHIPKENIIAKVCRCIAFAFRRRLARKDKTKVNVLDYAAGKFDCQLIEDIKSMYRVMILFLPIIVFWALFDQQGSTWVLQANRMNGRVGRLTILPDQMSVLNPLLIITLVPLFEALFYPAMRKCGILTKPLQRMSAGGILAAVAFGIAGFLQLKINQTMVSLPPKAHANFHFSNFLPCSVAVTSAGQNFTVEPQDTSISYDLTGWVSVLTNGNCPQFSQSRLNVRFNPQTAYYIAFAAANDSSSVALIQSYPLEKAQNGKHTFLVIADTNNTEVNSSVVALLDGQKVASIKIGSGQALEIQLALISSDMLSLEMQRCTTAACTITPLTNIRHQMGSVEALVLKDEGQKVTQVTLVPGNTVSLLWTVPQYIVITVGEILLSITGLEFSYSQAAPSMKSVLQAAWLLTTALGNVIDIIISGSHLVDEPATEFFVYAALMGVVVVVFIALAVRYKYVDHEKQDQAAVEESEAQEQIIELQTKDQNGIYPSTLDKGH